MSAYQVSAANEITVKNLLSAFACELNSHAKYLAFAAQAERECAFDAAALFRAIARSEKIHADNHARVIRQLGGKPEAGMVTVEAKTTIQNITEALDDEVRKIDSMYPNYLVQNCSPNNSAARSLTWALEADKEHARLLTEFLARMQHSKPGSATAAAREYYIRPVCGYVSRSREPERCCVCEHFCMTFEVVQ